MEWEGEQLAIFWGDPEESLHPSEPRIYRGESLYFISPAHTDVCAAGGIQGVVGARKEWEEAVHSGTLLGICGCQFHFIEQIFTNLEP